MTEWCSSCCIYNCKVAEFLNVKSASYSKTYLTNVKTLLDSLFQDLSRRSIETGFLADLKRDSNSLNSDSGSVISSEQIHDLQQYPFKRSTSMEKAVACLIQCELNKFDSLLTS